MKYYKYMRTKNYAHIYNITIDKFLTHKPPCKKCLVRAMCMYDTECMTNNLKTKLVIKDCKSLNQFMKRKKCFKKL